MTLIEASRNMEAARDRRLTVAAQILSGLLANPNVINSDDFLSRQFADVAIADQALKLADDLIAVHKADADQ